MRRPEVVGRRAWTEDEQRGRLGRTLVGHVRHDTRGGTIPLVSDLIILLVIILIIVVIWRGPKTIPEIGRMFGRGVREARAEAN